MAIIAAICYVIVYVNLFQRFTLTDISQIGRHSDGGILANSEFGKALECGQFKFPSHTSLKCYSLGVINIIRFFGQFYWDITSFLDKFCSF